MRSITRNDEKRYIIINLHLEEVFHNLFVFNTNFSIEDKTKRIGSDKYSKDQSSLLINDDKGIYQSSLSQSTILYLKESIPKVEDYRFFLMMNRIEKFGNNARVKNYDNKDFENEIHNNALREFMLLIKDIIKSNVVTISSIKSKVYKDIISYYNDPLFFDEKNRSKITLQQYVSDEHFSDVDERNKELWQKILQNRILQDDCREFYNKTSHSSPVKLKYYFNIKPLFNDPIFLCNAIYYLALTLKDTFDTNYSNKNRNKCLLAMSMNGMTICSLLAQLFEVDIIRIDHLGPYNELYLSSFERFVNPKIDYYIVSDVICMGREVSDAKAVLKMFGAKCKGIISFINIVPVGEKNNKTFSIINIDKNYNPYEYGINTDLNYDEQKEGVS